MRAVPRFLASRFRSISEWCRGNSARYALVLVVSVLVIGVALAATFWPALREGGPPSGGAEPLSATVRNLALILGGVVAVVLTVWRIRVSEQQAETARLGLLNERFQRGAEMLGSSVMAVRMGGIHALDDLARERAELHHIRVLLLLCAFVRHPTGYETNPSTQPSGEGETPWHPVRPDVHAAIEAVAYRSGAGLLIEDESDLSKERLLDLQGSDLRGASLNNSNFAGANFAEANLDYVQLTHAKLSGASFWGAHLLRANLQYADLSSTELSGAVMTKALAYRANFRSANLTADMTKMGLSQADLTDTQVGPADLTGANLEECDLTNAVFFKAYQSTTPSSGESETRTIYARLTQEQLDKAVCTPGQPPNIVEGTTDIETGLPLMWRGRNGHTCRDGAHLPCGNTSCKECTPCERCEELRQEAAP